MRKLFGIWSRSRMLALGSYTAALYAAAVIPFKYGLPLVPGATEVGGLWVARAKGSALL